MTNDNTPRTAPYPIVFVGHVDHGKSTLIGRLLHDTQSLPDGKFEELKRAADKRGGVFEWSFALDALQLERDQAITVDSTQIWFRSAKRSYLIIDAPGHREFLRNMITGASLAEAGVILVDVSQGVAEQTRRHAYLLKLLGISRTVVAVNKMDLAKYDEATFTKVSAEITAYLKSLDLTADHIIPIAARHGDNLVNRSAHMAWWTGPTLIEALDTLPHRVVPSGQPFRLPIQDVYRRDEERILVGRVESGTVRLGDAISLWPTGQTAKVATFQSWNVDAPVIAATAGQSIAITLDRDLFVERGQLITAQADKPQADTALNVRLFWLSHTPLKAGRRLTLKLATAAYDVVVKSIDHVIDVNDLSPTQDRDLQHNDIGQVTLVAERPIIHDTSGNNSALSRAVLFDKFDVVGGCVIEKAVHVSAAARNIHAIQQSVSREDRAGRNGHAGQVLWLTGLSGAGKTTIAMALQRQLFEAGQQAFVLDGDNVRYGLNSDLGFSDADRSENVRRTAEVAKLMAEAGLIVIVSLITPTNALRRAAREIVGAGYHQVFIDAPLETCQQRDPKGLYTKAKSGGVAQMTGVSSAWEAPDRVDLHIDTTAKSVADGVSAIAAYVADHNTNTAARKSA
ncbi:MAG: adenylyl-sulfate kinase [Rhodospirillaceae bacterium]|nr:adenylyl-sulfate kinase [Rhodospirillaceae bacterium]